MGVYVASNVCVPRGNVRSSLMSADHVPLGETEPPVTVKVELCPSNSNVSEAGRVLPLRSIIPEPLLEVREPLIVKVPPAVGFAKIGSIVKFVGDLTVIVVIVVPDECRLDEPLNNRVTTIRPRGCEWGTLNVKFAIPASLV